MTPFQHDRPFCAGKDGVGLSDEEFWEKVFLGRTRADIEEEEADLFEDAMREFDRESDPEADLNGYYVLATADGTKIAIRVPKDECMICHASAACGYDDMGRPWIHSTEEID